ncbi:transmembrane protein 209 [Ischnura elegans]|uniref:transmembrane protein 209 n=1 Tax=Ischnura elegans TaxID=197161 RepID=UPI001ED86850|nr:transmembrane protein 209 [Ischnura elegans]
MSRSPRCLSRSAVVEETLDMIAAVKKANQSLLWGAINICILAVVLYDIVYKCPAYSLGLYYGEIALAVILMISSFFHVSRYVYVNWYLKPIPLTPHQRRLMGISKLDPHFKASNDSVASKIVCSPEKQRSPSPVRHTPKPLISSPSPNVPSFTSPYSSSSLNSSAIGNSSASILSSPNYSMSSPSWVYHQSSPAMPNLTPTVGSSPYSPNSTLPTLSPYPLTPSFVTSPLASHSPGNPFSPGSLGSSELGRMTANPKTTFESSFMGDVQSSPTGSTMPVIPGSGTQFSPVVSSSSPITFSPNGSQNQPSLLYRCTYQLAPLVSALVPGRGRGDAKKREGDTRAGMAHSSPLSSGSASSPAASSPGSGSSFSHGIDIWQRVGVKVSNLERWTMNLRVWLSQTVVERLVLEIDSINEALGWNVCAGGVTGSKEGGTEEQGIGNVGLDRLRSAALVPHVITAAPNLSLLIPFLEATPNQKYLVARIRKLAEGGCMSSFNWSGEIAVEGMAGSRPASDVSQCPSDAFILAHLFATYLDTQMPSLPPSAVFLSQETLKTPVSVLSSIPAQSTSPGTITSGTQAGYIPLPLESPESRPFSIRHFARIPEELARKRKGAEEGGGHIIIYQAKQSPPHFQLVTPEEILDIGKGRNNFFHTILLFLHLIKTREHGMLGRVSLGKAGINLLWVIDGE